MKIPGVAGERGVALAVAVFALVVVGALVAAACLAGTLEQRSGRNTVYAAEAADAAESGNATTLGTWDATLNGLAAGDSITRSFGSAGPRTAAVSTVIRLNDQLFLVRSVGQRTDANGQVLARRTVAIVGRQVPESLTTSAALAVGRPIAPGGAALRIVGSDAVPAGWTGCAPLADQAAVRSATTTGIAGEDTTHLTGSPRQVSHDPAVARALFAGAMADRFERLGQTASVVLTGTSYRALAPSVDRRAPHRCDPADTLNWGEPRRAGADYVAACAGYFPTIHATGPRLALGAGRGQGLLLVDGDLELTGGVDFTGLILVRGAVHAGGEGNTVTGALLVENRGEGGRNVLGGRTTIQYSFCAVAKALAGAASVSPLTQRSWVQIY